MNIIVNATAARTSGGLTIIKDFMSYIYNLNNAKYTVHLITTTEDIFYDSDNVIIHKISVQNWLTRLKWDRRGFQEWCEHNEIIPDVIVSFQNTCSHFTGKYKNIKQLVYYHQLIPLVRYNWNPFRKDERKLFLYAHFYGVFVNRWNKNTEYVVQLPVVKELFCKKFPNIKKECVHVIRPNLPQIDVDTIQIKQIYENKKVFIYPATPLRYKNHTVILKALDNLKNECPDLLEKIKVVFTVPKDSYIAKKVQKMELEHVVDCIDSIAYKDLLSYYKRSDVLLFSSKIESFGLPLIEASMFGIPIITVDLSYAREVLEEYTNSVFINSDDFISWSNAIKAFYMNGKQIKAIKNENNNTWEQFEQIMLSL